MALHTINFQSSVLVPLSPCGYAYLCLKDEWSAKTASGLALVKVVVEHSPRALGYGLGSLFHAFFNVRKEPIIQYTFQYDDAQLLVDPETQLPYVLTCADICEIFPYACTLDKIVDAILRVPN